MGDAGTTSPSTPCTLTPPLCSQATVVRVVGFLQARATAPKVCCARRYVAFKFFALGRAPTPRVCAGQAYPLVASPPFPCVIFSTEVNANTFRRSSVNQEATKDLSVEKVV